MYTDDCTIHVSAEKCQDLNKMLQEELMLVSVRVLENKLKFNISETKIIHRTDQWLCISLHGEPTEQVKGAKLLGVTTDDKLS